MEFKRPKGTILTGPALWVDTNLPSCPLCKRRSEWETATALDVTVERHYFRCSGCQAILSAPATEVLPVLPLPTSLVISPLLRVIRIEKAGSNERLQHLAGTEYSLSELQEWATSAP